MATKHVLVRHDRPDMGCEKSPSVCDIFLFLRPAEILLITMAGRGIMASSGHHGSAEGNTVFPITMGIYIYDTNIIHYPSPIHHNGLPVPTPTHKPIRTNPPHK